MSNSIPRRANATVVAPAQTDYSAKRGQWVLCGKMVVSEKEAAAIKANPVGVPSVFRTLVQGDVIVLAKDNSENKYAPRWNFDNSFKENQAFDATPDFTLKEVLTDCLSSSQELDSTKSLAFANKMRAKYEEARSKATASVLAML